MFRSFTLGVDDYELSRVLNSRRHLVQKVDNYIADSGVAGTLLQYTDVHNEYSKRESPYRREIRKFHLGEGGMNEEVDQILEDRNNVIIQLLSKFTEEGPVVVVDYETKIKKGRG